MVPQNPVELTQKLVQCPSITPLEGGALEVLETELSRLGFTCHRLVFEAEGTPTVDNLYARLGTTGPVFGYAGHTDVVPVGDAEAWTVDPFAATIKDGALWGRGASDMKGSIAAFVVAVERFLAEKGPDFGGSIAFVITGDEEGPAINGTVKMLDWMTDNGEVLDVCMVGEPTNPAEMGDMIKIGRRGSVNGWITVEGTQGHVAYPHLAQNPMPALVAMAEALNTLDMDSGRDNPHFPATNLEITNIEVGNSATNVIPASGTIRFNIRFNDYHDGSGLVQMLTTEVARIEALYPDVTFGFTASISGDSFLTPPGPLSDLVAGAVKEVTGRDPELSTTGGTSDARFIKNMCPVIECGLINKTIHKVDEHARTADIDSLTAIYTKILDGYFDG